MNFGDTNPEPCPSPNGCQPFQPSIILPGIVFALESLLLLPPAAFLVRSRCGFILSYMVCCVRFPGSLLVAYGQSPELSPSPRSMWSLFLSCSALGCSLLPCCFMLKFYRLKPLALLLHPPLHGCLPFLAWLWHTLIVAGCRCRRHFVGVLSGSRHSLL